MELQHQLSPKLKQLRLSGVLATLDARHRQALDGVVVRPVSGRLLEDGGRRAQKQLALRIRRGNLNATKTWRLTSASTRRSTASGSHQRLRLPSPAAPCSSAAPRVLASHLAQALA